LVSEEVRDHIHVVAIAPARLIPEKMCRYAVNYAAKSDAVPRLQMGYNPIEYMSATNVNWVESNEKAPWMDHDFMSPTYNKPIKNEIKKIMEL
jgi:hypothetical protein